MPNKALTSRKAILLLVVLAGLVSGCREHPRVTSRESLDLIKQVYTACNTRNEVRLTKCRTELAELTEKGLISKAEKAAFSGILETAEKGDWETAQKSSLQFARDQLK